MLITITKSKNQFNGLQSWLLNECIIMLFSQFWREDTFFLRFNLTENHFIVIFFNVGLSEWMPINNL